MTFDLGSWRRIWRQRRRFGAWAGLVLMLLDLAGAAMVRPPDAEAARLLADSQLVCALGGMHRAGQPVGDRNRDNFTCVFCLPLAHAVGGAVAAPDLPVPRAEGGTLLALPPAGRLATELRNILPPARAPPSELERNTASV